MSDLKNNLDLNQNEEVVEVAAVEIESPWRMVWKRFKKNKMAIVGLSLLIILALSCIIIPVMTPYTHNEINLTNVNKAPSAEHFFGTDEVGRDVFTRVFYAGRISMTVGIVAVSIQVAIGATLGVAAGYYGGKIDWIIMRLVDIIMCIPFIPLLIILAVIMSDIGVPPDKRIYVTMVIIGGIGWTGLCRMVRGTILSLREQEFMQATEALGLKDSTKMFRHLLPNTFSVIIVSATLGLGGAIMTESSLSFLGLGVAPPHASWGSMIQSVKSMYSIQNEWWKWMPPGVFIFLTVMSINLLGDGLRDALDPKLKR